MPRQARQRSSFGYLHVIERSIGAQALFKEEEDYRFYLSILERYAKESQVTIAAYCLMENHVHLLVRDRGDGTSLLMKKIGISYAAYFNRKYEHTGHLFYGRFLSEPVGTAVYLLTVFRYILNNPVEAEISAAEDYPWSSYHLYAAADSFVDTSDIQEMIGGGYEEFVRFMSIAVHENCMDYENRRNDRWARKQIKRLLETDNGASIKEMDRQSRTEALQILKEEGMSVRQIERLTGINRNTVQRA